MSMKAWNKTSLTDLEIADGTNVDRVTAQFYNADTSDVEVTIKVTDNAGGVSGAKIIKKFTLAAEESGHYHINQLEANDTVTVTTGDNPNLNIVTWN